LWTADGSVTVDGSASEANWMFDSWIRGAAGAPDGSFAKLWNGTDLYFAVKTDGATALKATLHETVINVTLGTTPSADVEGVVVKQSGNILEMKVPFASIGFAMHGYTQQMAMAMELTNGELYDVVINCVSIENTEMGSILSCKDDGTVYFFSMATSFTKAALGAEGVGKDVNMIIGNGYTKNHADVTLQVLREHEGLRKLFEEMYA
jgi:hypothetical protein